MRIIRFVLGVIAFCMIGYVAIVDYTAVEPDMDTRHAEVEARLQEHVLSQDFDQLKSRLVDLEKAKWKQFNEFNIRTFRSYVILSVALGLLVVVFILQTVFPIKRLKGRNKQ